MILCAVRRVGNVLSGWDGYGVWHDLKVPHATASRVGQELCYVRSVYIREGRDF